MAERPTIVHVANHAGVSKGTVSRVLKGTYPVSKATRDAVMAAVEELGYTPSVRAKALATGKSETIAIIISEPFDQLFEDPTFSCIMRGIFDSMMSTEYVPLLLHTASEAEQRKALRLINNQAVDAVIHISPWSDHTFLEELLKLPIPVVLCGQVENQKFIDKFSLVYADDADGAQSAASYMRSLGVKNPVAILGPHGQPATRDRLLGYQRIYTGITGQRAIEIGWDEQSGVKAMREIIDSGLSFDGVLAASDRIARGALTVLENEGIRVPEEVKLIGFDDHEVARRFSPQLTTVSQPMQLQGECAFQLALEMVHGAANRTVVLPTEIMVRDTTNSFG